MTQPQPQPDPPPAGTQPDKLRRRIAEEAARILSQGGDSKRARFRAARRLTRGWVAEGDLPSHDEVRRELGRASGADLPAAGGFGHLTGDRFDQIAGLVRVLATVRQDPRKHPEGDVLAHTLQVFDRVHEERPFDEELLTAALVHEIGRRSTAQTTWRPASRRWVNSSRRGPSGWWSRSKPPTPMATTRSVCGPGTGSRRTPTFSTRCSSLNPTARHGSAATMRRRSTRRSRSCEPSSRMKSRTGFSLSISHQPVNQSPAVRSVTRWSFSHQPETG